ARRSEVAHARADVGLHLLVRQLLHERPVVPVVGPLADPGGAAEVVERDGCVAALGEAERELLVEAVEAADVRQDHDPGRDVSVRNRPERREAVAVAALEDEVVVRDGGARDPRNRRLGVDVEAHGREPTKGGARRAAYPEGGGRRVAAGRDERRDPRPARAGGGAAVDAAAGGGPASADGGGAARA